MTIIQFYLWDNSSKQFKQENDKVGLKDPSTLEKFKTLVTEHAHWKIIDFDNHLDDISKDWLNQ